MNCKSANTSKRHIILIKTMIFLSICSLTWGGYSQKSSEFSVQALGGFSYVDYETQQTFTAPERNWGLGLGYGFYLNENWSLQLAGIYQRYTAKLSVAKIEDQYQSIDLEQENFVFQFEAQRLKEQQQVGNIQFPLSLQWQTSGETKFYFRAGAQVNLVLEAEFDQEIDFLKTSGYYPQYEVTLNDPLFMGFGRFDDVKTSKQNLNWQTTYSAIFESGIKSEVYKNQHFYIGFFLNYGLKRLDAAHKNNPLVEYQSKKPDAFKWNSLSQTPLAQNARLMSYGIKLRYAWGGF